MKGNRSKINKLNSGPLRISKKEYEEIHRTSIQDRDFFFHKSAVEYLDWDDDAFSVHNGKIHGGKINCCYNAVDRHVKSKPNKIAFIHDDYDGKVSYLTYKGLYEKILRITRILMDLKIQTGDFVTFYASNSPDIYSAVLACSRLGIVVNFVFGGYSPEILASRMRETNSKLLITVDCMYRNGKKIDFLLSVLDALDILVPSSCPVLVFNSEEFELPSERINDINSKIVNYGTDLGGGVKILPFSSLRRGFNEYIPCIPVKSSHTLLCMFTSGSTGKSKGILHSTGGYLLLTAMTAEYCFNFEMDDIFFSTADIGWLAGVSHSLLSPLLLGGTTVVFSGSPFFPSSSRIFDIISRHSVTQFYTSPTVLRILEKKIVEEEVSLPPFPSSLKVIGCVGEPLTRNSVDFLKKYSGDVPIVDTYWQTETGSIILSGLYDERISVPFFGINVVIKDGILLLQGGWPSMAKGILNNEGLFKREYLERFPGFYYTGDSAVLKNGVTVLGRVDDIINMCGHRLGTREVEEIVSMTEGVVESAIVVRNNCLSGQNLCIFVVPLSTKKNWNEEMIKIKNEIRKNIRKRIGPILKYYDLIIVKELPKTRTGKIMRKLIRNIIEDYENISDVSNCLNSEVILEIRGSFLKAMEEFD